MLGPAVRAARACLVPTMAQKSRAPSWSLHSSTSAQNGVPRALLGGAARRAMSSMKDQDERQVYKSVGHSQLSMLSTVSAGQLLVCAGTAALVAFHPAAATSALLPGWSAEGRGLLGAALVGFGVSVVFGVKGFVSKHIVALAVSGRDSGVVLVDVLAFPSGVVRHTVPIDQIYAISAAYGSLDLDAESKGPAPIAPIFVGGGVNNTFILDMRGEFLDKAAVQEILNAPESVK